MLSRRPLHAVLVAAVLAAPLAPAGAQDWKGQGRLEGRVQDNDGKPIEGATLKLDNPKRGGGPTVKTDKKGRWAYLGLVAGSWNIDVEAPGYATKRISVDLSAEGARVPPIEIKIEKAAPTGPPPEVLAALDKAETAYKEGRNEEAVAEFERLLALRPELASQIHQRIGFSYIRLKNHAKALEHLQKAIAAEPANQQLRAIAAQAALEGGLLDQAAELLKGLDEATIKEPDVLFNIGVNFINANRPEEGITYFSKAVALDPTYADGYFRRGLACIQLGKNAEAKADLAKFLELKPEGPEAELAKKALQSLK
jgi:tetratricopeptide (TPR) repeat protein